MCKVCSNICADYYFVHPLEYEQTITKIQDLIEQKQLILVKGNCDIDKYQDENGCWADDI